MDVIVSTPGGPTALAVKSVVRTIPILFTSGDPVSSGLVASLDRPGGNLTGVSLLTSQLDTKRLELLKQAIPRVSRVAVLANPTTPWTGASLKDVEGAARALRVKLQVLEARDSHGLRRRSRPSARAWTTCRANRPVT